MKLKIIIIISVLCFIFASPSYAFSEFFPCNSSSNGTESYPYLISSASDLRNLSSLINSGEENYSAANYTVVNSIDLENIEWIPIGNASHKFSGNFDGGGYGIYNLSIGGGTNYNGLFGTAEGSGLRNIRVSGNIESGYTCGMIAGNIKNGVVENCIAEGNLNSSSKDTGGLVGYADSTDIINSCFIGNVSCTKDNAGGIAGRSTKNIISCYAVGNVSGKNSVGGIVGFAGGSNKYMNNSASLLYSVKNTGVDSGRIAGKNLSSFKIINSYALDEMISVNSDGIDVSCAVVWNNKTFFEETLLSDFENEWKMNSDNPNFALPVPKCLKESFYGSAEYLIPLYDIFIHETEGGTVTADNTKAKAGEVVLLENISDSGYTFLNYNISYGDIVITMTDNSFVMPDSAVDITGVFSNEEITGIPNFIFCGTEGTFSSLSGNILSFESDNSSVMEITDRNKFAAKSDGAVTIYGKDLSGAVAALKKVTVSTDSEFRTDNVWDAVNTQLIEYNNIPKNYSVIRPPEITRGLYSYKAANFSVRNETVLTEGTDYFVDEFGQINLISPSGNYSYEFCGCKLGDTNGDGEVDITDAALISIRSISPSLIFTDEETVNSNVIIGGPDDELNFMDSQVILEYIVGLRDSGYERVQ